jgi:hypothetical protein
MTFGLPVYEESVSAVTDTPSVRLGARRYDVDGNEYVYCYNAANCSLDVGVPLFWGTSNTGYSFTCTNPAGASLVGLVAACTHHKTFATDQYGWAGTKGLFRVIPDSNSISWSTGAYLMPNGNNNYGGWRGATMTTYGTGVYHGIAVTSGVCGNACPTTLTCLGLAWLSLWG